MRSSVNSCWLCCTHPACGELKHHPHSPGWRNTTYLPRTERATLWDFPSQLGNEAVPHCWRSQEHHPCCLEESEVSNRIVSLEIYWWCFFIFFIVLCSLHMNLLVTNFHGCKLAFHQPRTPVIFQFFLRLLSLMILQLYHLPCPLPAAVSDSSLVTLCQPLQASCCTVLLYFSR